MLNIEELKAKAETLIKSISGDKDLLASFTKDPIGTLEKKLGIDLPDEQINQLISAYMREVDIELIDFTLEFGRFKGSVMVADEISPDVARFWDAKTHEPLDIDRFRRDMGNAEQAYQELLHRMMGLVE